MFFMKYLIYFNLLHWIFATPHINLYYTDWVSESDETLQHDCLRLGSNNREGFHDYQLISYCMSEPSSKFLVEINDIFSKFTFAELAKLNITSHELYIWSAPIDIIEHYQFYLNQLTISNYSALAKVIFYNCTLPRFGPRCQYELVYDYSEHLSLYQIINNIYSEQGYDPITLTCYIHLQCDRGPFPACLDWGEICDGKIDCLDGPFDEEHCLELEINICKDSEYRCTNGQCIPQSFYRDNRYIPDCFDSSDEEENGERHWCYKQGQPSIGCEDVKCNYIPLPESCTHLRTNLLLESIYLNKDVSISNNCWSAFTCILKSLDQEYSSCNDLCQPSTCIEIVTNHCPAALYILTVPVLFGDIYFAYTTTELHNFTDCPSAGLHVCYNKSYYNDYFINIPKVSFNNMTCIHYHQFVPQLPGKCSLFGSMSEKHSSRISKLTSELKRYHLPFAYTSTICNRPNVYQCIRSIKCISIHRLIDTVYDCPHMDDENITIINNTKLIEQIQKNYFKCQVSNTYIHPSLVRNRNCDCKTSEFAWCEDEAMDSNYIRRNISFQTICYGFIELFPIIIDGRNETDETECEQWQCNNMYTRCNNVWNCPDGADERNCISYSTLNCSSKHHLCVSPDTNQVMCLPIEKINDGNADCLGASDEPTLCRRNDGPKHNYNFYCRNQRSTPCIDSYKICDGHQNCDYGDDEQFCQKNQTLQPGGICTSINHRLTASSVEKLLCYYSEPYSKYEIVHFTLDGMYQSNKITVKKITKTIFSDSSTIEIPNRSRCHRGLDLSVWLNNNSNSTTNTCLCPPSFYGNQCQYQNQRISLAIAFQALSDSWQTPFAIIISLIDDSNERIIHSSEQFTYLSIRDCKNKFNINLLYATRPKDPTKHYSIHVDIYEKISLVYRGSILLPITFPFLPVYRLALIINIPQSNNIIESCSDKQCINGECIKYSIDSQNATFCQCNPGWSGQYCTIQYICACSFDSLCLGISANNRSICVCPLNKFGSRCLLTNPVCLINDNSTCQNNGQCIVNDDYIISDQKFVCICKKGFSGDRCEIVDNKLFLSFEKSIVLSQSIFIHFIEVNFQFNWLISTVRSTTFRTIPIKQDSIIIYWSRPFHLVFSELSNKNYYLTIIQTTYNQSTTIIRMINPSDRCPHISELFNETFVKWHLIRRIKYYHLPCQNQSLNLSCFYDDVHFCSCYDYDEKRLANCFNFDHNMTFDCFGQSACENGAQCLQDTPYCPTRSVCICPSCFYGTRCQFSTNGFGLSLDAILGYYILPNITLTHQPFIIKMSLALTIIFIVAGLINSLLSMITFKNKCVLEVGCALYLFSSSITTLFTTLMFGLKFLVLVYTQISTTSNRSFLLFQCHSIDFLLRVCLCMDQWLNACVAVERAFTAIKGTRFEKRKSKRTAKFVIIILLIFIVGTSIHDSIFRHLIDEVNGDDDDDDGNVKRIWCALSNRPGLHIYNSVINTFHFVVPFTMNLIGAIILIVKKSHRSAVIHPEQSYREHFRIQIQQHKHLLTAPVVLVILTLPRLIITFVSKCMKSTNDVWLYFIGYFISFIPSMLTFVVFVLPSKYYRKEFQKSAVHYRTILQRLRHWI